MDRKKTHETFWHPRKPPKSLNSRTMAMLDFEILKTLTSQKNVDIKGRSFRSFTDIIAEVRFFYFLRDNKHFKYVQRDLTDFMPRQGQLRIDQINKAKRYCDFTLIVKGETSSVLSESLRKLKGTGYNRNFLLDWESCTTSNITDHINHVEQMAVKEITGNSVQFGIYNQQKPSDILLSKIKMSDQSFDEISKRTGVPITMIYRHTQNKAPIDREYAIMYAKYFGMDPSEILFNDISVPLEGTVNFKGEAPGEVKKKIGSYEFVKCPRDIYRPDIKCVRVEDNSIYGGCNLFYYQSKNSEVIADNQLYIFLFGEGRKKNKVVGRIDMLGFKQCVKNPDPEVYDLTFRNIFNKRKYGEEIDISKMLEDNQNLFCSYGGKYLSDLSNEKPVAIYPIVAIINSEHCVKNEHRSSLIKEEEEWYKRRTLEDGGDLTDVVYSKDTRSEDLAELKEKIYNSLEAFEHNNKPQTFLVKKELTGELDKVFNQSLNKLQKKLEKISSDVRELGYPDFKLPDPKEELKQLENDLKKTDTQTKKSSHPINNMKYIDANKKKNKNIEWLIDPDLPIDINNFIKLDPKRASDFFNHGIEGYENLKIFVGEAKGKNRAEVATKLAMKADIDSKLSSATEILVVVTGNNSITLGEVDKVVLDIREKVKPDTDLVFAAIFDDNMEEDIRVSVLPAFEVKLKDHILIQNAINNFYFYRSIGARKDALRMALGSPALNNEHRDEVVKKIAEKTPEVLSYNKAEIFPLRRTG